MDRNAQNRNAIKMEIIKAVYILRKTKIKKKVLHYCAYQFETAEIEKLNFGFMNYKTTPKFKTTKKGFNMICETFFINRLFDFFVIDDKEENNLEKKGFRVINWNNPQFSDIYKKAKKITLLAVGDDINKKLVDCNLVGVFVLKGVRNDWFSKKGIFSKKPEKNSPLISDLLDLILRVKYQTILPQSHKQKLIYDLETFLRKIPQNKM